jgi:hypothetical protein
MSFVKTSVTLAIGTVFGVALKCAKDFNNDRKIVEQLSARYRKELEAALPGLKVEAEQSGLDVAQYWDHGISSITFGENLVEVDSSHYSSWVKERVTEALEELYREYKVYKPA